MTVLGFLVAAFLYFRSILKPTNTEKSKDVVVPSVSVLDGEVFRQATEQLKLNSRQQEMRETHLRELQRELREQTEIMRECRDFLRTACEHLDNVDRRLRIEIRRQSEARE